MIPEGFITNLLDRADIVDVVSRYVPLKKAGRNYMCCCPFHKEKTPSFSVSPTKQFYKCFGCGKGGNAIGFVMEIEHLSFPEAVEKLAGYYGLEVPKDTSPRAQAAREKSKTLADFMKEAADYYTAQLRATPKAVEYLRSRAISGETAARFGLGYSPEGWHALEEVFKEKYSAPALLEAGLVNEKNGRRYDAFRDRLMFPIRNPKGQVIGFGARTLKGDEQPKYLNSPETPIYHKGSELYGLFEGRDAVHEKGRAIVCEGYMDVIQLSQAGFPESVAALGTSITPEHVKRLFKLTDRVYFSFDGDGAGRKAARRALEAALPVLTDTQQACFVLLPPEHDPDSLIKAKGPEAYERELENALTLSAFMKKLLLEGKELMYAEERAKLVAEAKPWILSMQAAPVLRLALVKEIAAMARLQPEDVERQYGLASSPAPRHETGDAYRPVRSRSGFGYGYDARAGARRPGRYGYARNLYERFVPEAPVPVKDVRDRMLQCFLAYPNLLTEFSTAIEDEFVSSTHPAAARILEVWRAAAQAESESDGRAVRAATLLQALAESPEREAYETLLSEELVLETPEEGARLELKRSFLDLELERTKMRLMDLGRSERPDFDQMRRLMARRTEVDETIRLVREEEARYRRRQETSFAASASGGSRAAKERVLSDNPKVRELQLHLFGGGENTSSTSGSSCIQANAAPDAARPNDASGSPPNAPASSSASIPDRAADRSEVARLLERSKRERAASNRPATDATAFDTNDANYANPADDGFESLAALPASGPEIPDDFSDDPLPEAPAHMAAPPPPEDEGEWVFDEETPNEDDLDFGIDLPPQPPKS